MYSTRSRLGWLAVALSATVLGACGIQASRPSLASLPGSGAAARQAPGRWLAVQFHAHSKHSDGRLTVAEVIDRARREGLDALGLSDHDTKVHFQDPGYQGDEKLTLIHSYEWTSKEGHAGIHGTTDATVVPWEASKEELLSHVAAGRETLIMHHPRFPLGAAWVGDWDPRASAVEVWNSHYLYPTNVQGTLQPAAPGDRLANERAIRWWHSLLVAGKRVPITAASDFHTWPQSIGSPCTLVYAAENSERAILDALRAGRSQGVQEPRAMRIDLVVEGGERPAMVGDTVAADRPLAVRATVTRGKGMFLTLHGRDGIRARVQVPADPWTYEAALPAEAGKADFVWARLDNAHWPYLLTALTSPIYVNLP